LLPCLLLAACPSPEPEPETPGIEDPTPPEDPCGDGEWGHWGELPDRVYVATWGREGAPGTREDPLASIQAGMDLAAEAGMEGVLVAGEDRGSVYPEMVELDLQHDKLDLRGRCA